MKIVLVAPYPSMAQDARQVCRIYGERVDVIVGNMEEGVRAATQAVKEGASVLISRGGTSLRLAEELSVPVVEIAVTPFDVIRTINDSQRMGTRFGIVGFVNVVECVTEWCSLLNKEVVPIIIDCHGESLRQKLRKVIQEKGIDCIIGDQSVSELAESLQVPVMLIKSGKEAILAAIQEAKRIQSACLFERQSQATLRSALDITNQGILLLENGVIQFANRLIGEFATHEPESHPFCIGLSAADCLPPALSHFLSQADKGEASTIIQFGNKQWMVCKNKLPEPGKILLTLQPVEEIESLERKVRRKKHESGQVVRYTFHDLYGSSQAMRSVVNRAVQFAKSDASVLIVGETGTGKEILAQSIHSASARSHDPFVAINCCALPDQLLESELFGYEEGAFTGAIRGGKPGLFELAHGGTIFLDEIGETPHHVQQKLLRVLQEKQVMRIGGKRVLPVDVRVIAATNKPLWQFVEEGEFRKDLFFRLDVLRLRTVPLRDRSEDIPELVHRLLYQIWYRRNGIGKPPRIRPEIFSLLGRYDWPGNVRELQNMVDYLFAVCEKGEITPSMVREWFNQRGIALDGKGNLRGGSILRQLDGTFAGTLDEIEQWAILQALESTQGDVSKAAQKLGVSRTTLWRKLKKRDEECVEATPSVL